RRRDFRREYPLSSLSRYDSNRPLAGPGDVVAGPFGLHVDSVRASERAGAGLEVAVEVYAATMANMGERWRLPRIAIDQALGSGGEELLLDEACGADRNGRPVELEPDLMGDWMHARATLRLVEGTPLDAVESLRGHVELSLPVRTQVVGVPAEVGAETVRDDVRVEITGVSQGFFSYRVSGAADKVLDLRGTGSFGSGLVTSHSWTSDLAFDGGRVGSRSVRGTLEGIDVIFVAEAASARYAFRFDSARPGSDKQEQAGQSVRFIEYSAEQYAREYSDRFGVPFDVNPRPRARTTAGPFTLALAEGELTDEGVTRRLQVLAPNIPNLSYNLTALEVRLRDARTPLYPRYRFGREELTCALDLGTEPEPKLEGELVLRLARGVESSRLTVVEPGRSVESRGVRLEVVELGRDRLSTRIEGDVSRLVTVGALNEDGEPLRVEPLDVEQHESAVLRHFKVSGKPMQLEIQVAEGSERLSYPFRLDWPSAVPAAPAR
ncbi:MAG: hypothetical protein JRG76_02665, partial [Deltaproteobacteria bacterium]|nr:hypothetical protein [Deltaproteobacteria bacterium]